MELAAPEEEVAAAFAGCGGGGCPFLLYGEDRAHTIRMAHFAAHRWFTPEYAAGHPGGRLALDGQRDEYVSFQVGVLAGVGPAAVTDLAVRFEDFVVRGLHDSTFSRTVEAVWWC
jgi:hypothetical protein